MEISWQNSLVRLAALVACVSLLVAGACISSAATGGSGSTLPTAALVIILPAVSALLLLLVCVLREREAISERLPTITPKRLGWAFLAALFIVPVLHLGFALIVCSLGVLAVVAALPNHWFQARAVAVCDALLCIALAEVMRNAGAGGDYDASRAVIALYATFGGVVMPSMTWANDSINNSKFGRSTLFGYAVLALHAALIMFQAIGNLVFDATKGKSSTVGTDGCIRSSVPSPTGFALSLLGSYIKKESFDPGPNNSTLFCPTPEPGLVSVAAAPSASSCSDAISSGWIGFWLAMGVWTSALILVLACWHCNSARVEPEDGEDSPRRRRSWRRCKVSPKMCMCVVALFAGLVGLAAWAPQELPCPEFAPPAGQMATNLTDLDRPFDVNVPTSSTTSTTTTATSTTTTTVTSTTSSTSSSTSRTSTSTSVTETWTATTTAAADLITTTYTITETATNTTTVTVTTLTSTTSTTLTTTRTTTTTIDGIDCPPLPVVVAGEVSEVLAPDPPDEGGCQCGGPGIHHWAMAAVAVPVTQLSQLWCELGAWAPLLVGFFIYSCHALTFALVAEETHRTVEHERHVEYKASVARARRPPVVIPPEQLEAARTNTLVLFRPAEREPLPPPVSEGSRGARIFMV